MPALIARAWQLHPAPEFGRLLGGTEGIAMVISWPRMGMALVGLITLNPQPYKYTDKVLLRRPGPPSTVWFLLQVSRAVLPGLNHSSKIAVLTINHITTRRIYS